MGASTQELYREYQGVKAEFWFQHKPAITRALTHCKKDKNLLLWALQDGCSALCRTRGAWLNFIAVQHSLAKTTLLQRPWKQWQQYKREQPQSHLQRDFSYIKKWFTAWIAAWLKRTSHKTGENSARYIIHTRCTESTHLRRTPANVKAGKTFYAITYTCNQAGSNARAGKQPDSTTWVVHPGLVPALRPSPPGSDGALGPAQSCSHLSCCNQSLHSHHPRRALGKELASLDSAWEASNRCWKDTQK